MGVAAGAVVTATATAADGSTSEFSSGLVAASPRASAGPDRDANEGAAVAFDGTGSTSPPGGGTLSYFWNFGDNTTGTGATPTHAYADDGTYTVVLLVRDALGAEATDSAVVTVHNVAPQNVTAGANQTVAAGTYTVTFTVADDGGTGSAQVVVTMTGGAPTAS